MNIGLDIGYSSVKVMGGFDNRATFPSIVGTPDRAHFSLNGNEHSIVLLEPAHVQVGEIAARQSRLVKRREDRAWIESPEWYQLFIAALSELTTGNAGATLVTGLPVAFYSDKERLQNILTTEHPFKREGRNRQTVKVQACRVVPQPFGALLADCLSNTGVILRKPTAEGVIDIGGKTTNLLSVAGFEDIARETSSVSVGAWDVARAVQGYLTDACPNLDLRDHQLMTAVRERAVTYYGERVDLSAVVEDALAPMAEQVIAQATQLWNGAAALSAVWVTGGGALLLGDRIKAHFRHARVVSDPVWANATGFYRLAQYVERAGAN